MGSPKCPVCSASVRTENLSKHLQSVHPREAKPEMVLEAERKATQTVRPPPPRSFNASLPRNVIIVVLILAVLAGSAWVVATSPAYSPYNANTSVLQMCMQESSGLACHDHDHLSITTPIPMIHRRLRSRTRRVEGIVRLPSCLLARSSSAVRDGLRPHDRAGDDPEAGAGVR